MRLIFVRVAAAMRESEANVRNAIDVVFICF